tara:strand:- start:671 stop:826 length:156 start_codon:yes stop_codon:yes gene_type:complete
MAKTGIMFQELGIKTKGSIHQTRLESSVTFFILTTQLRLALGGQRDLITLW